METRDGTREWDGTGQDRTGLRDLEAVHIQIHQPLSSLKLPTTHDNYLW